MKYKTYTLGCKVNSYETEAIIDLFEKEGYTLANNKEIANICLVNTCSVTARSDAKSRQKIRQLIRQNPNCIMVVMGCYSQKSSEEISKIDGVSIIIGTNYRKEIVKLIQSYLKNKQQIVLVEEISDFKSYERLSVIKFSENTRAYVKIQDGCENYCSFCIIPYTRGKFKSRPKEDVLNEIKFLVKQGYQEVVLTGIHTGGYGIDFEDYSFFDLLNDIVTEISDLNRLRISSIEVNQVNDQIIDLIKTSNIIVDHLHIPLQSGSDFILRRMNRKYDTNFIIERIKYLKKQLPLIAITTDVIVGFPFEEEIHFQETMQTIEQCGFAMLHVFPFSRREGTPAHKMKNQVDPQTKKDRVNTLINISNKNYLKYGELFLNKTLEVLFETIDKDGYLKGHTTNYLLVKAKGNKDLIGSIKKVKLIKHIQNDQELAILGEIL